MKNKITSFKDLDIYKKSYEAAITIIKKIVPQLPTEEKYDLGSQLRRSSKAVPRLIAEGYSKRHQKRGFQKYLDDALAESNETVVSLSQTRDIYQVEPEICTHIIGVYEVISRQIFRLSSVWVSFKR
ncbi:four helix bundle protein [candidate division WOR-3 bacterium]|nr:four helix bundle protein [candidate division WOR-3 bacterium]